MDAQKPRDPMNLFVSLERIHTSDVPKIDPVDPRLVTKIKKLGEGGQGIAYSATYPGVNGELAAKYLRPQALQNPKVVQETEQEVAFMRTLTHPNCHQLIGATLRPEICLLSEICPMGSIFDYYTAKLMPTGKRFDEQTARRLALESASGLEFIHNLRFMHRDIKSLNVFLSSAMTAKVADFGMATADPTSTEPAGTVQWMAPEVRFALRV
ncbi:kinase-like domain-containing protein [Baffinella frigidus]|nr:kinase-like domain-containing protein [Cryptophyta sp. CCMP2293]